VKRLLDRFSRRVWAVALVFALIGAGVGVLRMYLNEYQYSATATVYVTPPISSSASDALTADQYAANRTQLYLSLIESPDLARTVLDRLQVNQSPEDLAERVAAEATPQTSLLRITANGVSPADARNLATAYAESLSSFARSVEGSGGLRGAPSVITVALPVADDPTFIQQYGVLAALTVGAGLLGALLSYAYRRRFPNVRTTDQLRRQLHVALVEEIDMAKPDEQLRRLQAELLIKSDDDGCLMVVGGRSRDQAEAFSELLSRSIQDSGREVRTGESSTQQPQLSPGRPDEVVIVDIPALLEDGVSAAALHRAGSGQALLVTRYDITSMRDAKEVMDLLTMNNIAVCGAIILRRGKFGRRRQSTPEEQPATHKDDSEPLWPAIDVLDAEKHGRPVRAD
jgi:hypothetical protein